MSRTVHLEKYVEFWLIEMCFLLHLMSYASIVASTEVVTVAKVLPATQENLSDVFTRNQTLQVLKPPDSAKISLNLEPADTSSNKLEYRDVTGSGDPLGEIIVNAFEPEEVMSANGLEWLLNVYNPHHWGNSVPGKLGVKCDAQMKIYLSALNNGTTWAAKMTDASGRYSSQFFFGNDFWLGSHTLCHELENRDLNPDSPPFNVQFHVARLKVALSTRLTPASRRVFLGLCLPRSCGTADITSLLRPGAHGNNTLQVMRVRTVPGTYNFLADTKFHILGGVLAVMCVLIAAGSCYDFLQSREKPSADNNNQSSDLALTNHKEKTSQGVLPQLLLSFSAIRNSRRILNCDTAEDSLTSIHGLRFLSLAWVILVHTYLQVFSIAENKTLRTVTERNFMFQTISNATFSVDTFFFISGLLVTFLYYRTTKKQQQADSKRCSFREDAIKFFTLLFYRFVRLTPAYLFVLGLVEISMRALHNSSVFEPHIMDHLNCENYWWRNALYINSLFPRKEMCMLWSWYMANDTQFYVLGILLLLVSVKHFRVVAAIWGTFLVSSWCTTAVISYHYEYFARIQEPFAQFDALYDKPWTRIGPYLIGMGTGCLLHRTGCSIKMPALAVISGWILSLLCLFSLVYGLLHVQLGLLTSAVYVSLGHTAWGLALAWIVVACCSGYGGIINTLLSFKALYPLSRLTYCAYLVHPLIMVVTSFNMDGPLHLHNLLVFILYLGNVMAAFTISFFISLVFEAPVVSLLKITMTSGKKDTQKK